MAVWMCRAGSRGEHEKKFLADGRIYGAWEELRIDLTACQNKAEVIAYLENSCAGLKHRTAVIRAGQMRVFSHEMQAGDWVMLPGKFQSVVHVGELLSPCLYEPENPPPYRHFHEVDWFAPGVPKELFDQDIRYTIGSLLAVCRVKQEARIRALLKEQKG